MKTLAETLRAADPLAYEPPRSVQRRRVSRQAILDAPRLAEEAPRRPAALATVVAVAIIGIALSAFQWSRTAVDVVAAVRFEVRLAEEKPAAGLREAPVVGTDRKTYLHSEPVVANGDIVQARVVDGDTASTYGVSVTLSAEGGAKMLRATQGHVGRPLAILVDGEVIGTPIVRSPTSTSGIISGIYTKAEAERIVGGILGR